MSEFKFNRTVKTLEIEGVTYEIDLGNAELMKKWRSSVSIIQGLMEKLDGDDAIDSIIEMEKEIITMVLGDWERLWDLAGKNIFVMLQLVKEISGFVNGQVSEIAKEYT